jgi:hypothetical protein
VARNVDLAWAISALKEENQADAQLARDYYRGTHRLAFAIDRFDSIFGSKFLPGITDNLCAAVIDSLTDRLEVTGVTSSAAEQQQEPGPDGTEQTIVRDAPAAAAWSVWKANDMDLRSTDVHREALLTGDGYVIVWPTSMDAKAAIWPRSSSEMTVRYSELVPGALDLAARRWRDRTSAWHLDLYYPDRVELYATKPEASSWVDRTLEKVGLRDVEAFELDRIVEHPYGRVPVFHFPNKRLYDAGIGELGDVIPIQDTLNKALCDMAVAMEYASFPQRWATGLEVEIDEATGLPKRSPFIPGVERVFSSPDPQTQFGEFGTADLRQFLEVHESLRAEIARVSGIPLHYLYISKGDFPSGEAMKSAEARFSKKIRDRQAAFGNVWEDVLSFSLEIEQGSSAAESEAFELETHWVSPTPRSEEEHIRTLTLKKAIGLSLSQLLREVPYSEDVIAQIISEGPLDPAATVPPPPGPGAGAGF